MSSIARAALVAAASFSMLLAGCDVLDDRDPSGAFDSAVRVNLTDDASSSLASAEVVFSRVMLVGAQDGGAVVELAAPQHAPARIDLVRLGGDLEAMLAEAAVPPGRYGKLSVVLDRARIRLAPGLAFADGSVEREIEPDGGRARFVDARLDAPIDARPGSLALVVVGFDVDESFVVERDPSDSRVVTRVRLVPRLDETRRHVLPLD